MINIIIDGFVPLGEVSKLPKIDTFISNCKKPLDNSFLNEKPFVKRLTNEQWDNLTRKRKIEKIIKKL